MEVLNFIDSDSDVGIRRFTNFWQILFVDYELFHEFCFFTYFVFNKMEEFIFIDMIRLIFEHTIKSSSKICNSQNITGLAKFQSQCFEVPYNKLLYVVRKTQKGSKIY